MWIIDEFESQLRKEFRINKINGSISAAIVKQDRTVWSKPFGSSHQSGDRLADPHTVYWAGSIARSLTAFLLMLLVQEGTIELDRPVETSFPEIRELDRYSNATKITFRQIASHTGGLVREPKIGEG